jgi:uncharacterized DUF497 family protein
VEFDWDKEKQRSNLEKHGIDFDEIEPFFDSSVVEEIDQRQDYGEIRISAYGQLGSRVLNVVYTRCGTVYRIISARKANDRERRKYYQSLQRRMETEEGKD